MVWNNRYTSLLGKNTLYLLRTSLPGQFQDIRSPDKLIDHDIVAETLKVVIPPIKKPRRKVYLYQKGDYESMRKDAFEFAKEKYFNGFPDTRSVQENFNLITSFIQDSADKHIPSKTVLGKSSNRSLRTLKILAQLSKLLIQNLF